MSAEDSRIARLRYLLIEGAKGTGVPMPPDVVVRLSNSIAAVMEAEGIRLIWQSTFDEAFRELMREDDK